MKRKHHNLYRVSTDVQFLSDKLVKISHTFSLGRDCIQTIGPFHCDVMSVTSLWDAYHTLRIASDSQKYCGITPFYSSPTYFYMRPGMGLIVWMQFINKVVQNIPNRYTGSSWMMPWYFQYRSNFEGLANLFKAFIKIRWQIIIYNSERKMYYSYQTVTIKISERYQIILWHAQLVIIC